MQQQYTDITTLASEAYSWFETAHRVEGDEDSEFTRLKQGAPEWVTELVHSAHGDFLPDDWRYAAIRSAVGEIGDNPSGDLDELESEWADGYVDIYTMARFKWLASNLQRQYYCDEALGEFGDVEDIQSLVGLGQYMECREVFAAVRSALEEVAATREP